MANYTNSKNNFPRCELHGHQLVYALPRGCCMRSEKVYDAVLAYRDRGYVALSNNDHSGGRDDIGHANICEDCISRLISNSTVQRLRAKALTEAGRPTAPAAQPKPSPVKQQERPRTSRKLVTFSAEARPYG